MTEYTFAQIDEWATKVDTVLDSILSQSVNDLLSGIEVVPGINRGGSRQRGTIPRDFGKLAASLQSTLQGSTSLTQTGEASYALVVANIKAEDVATFSWGTGEDDYAFHVHYGANGVPGTFWVDVARTKWQGYVNSATARARSELL